MLYTKLNSQQLLEKIKDSKGFHVTVNHNPFGEGGKQTLIAETNLSEFLGTHYLSTHYLGQDDIEGIDYSYDSSWTDGTYKGTFDLDTTPFQNIKPEVYKVGDTVKILENVRECGNYNEWAENKKETIGKIFKIFAVDDSDYGVSYGIQHPIYLWFASFPAYCIQKIEPVEPEPEPEPQTITIGGDTYPVTPEFLTALSNLKKI